MDKNTDIILNNIEIWKQKLLDISLKNQSINFKRRGSATISLLYPDINKFLYDIVPSKSVYFADLFDEYETLDDKTVISEEKTIEKIKVQGVEIIKKDYYTLEELQPCINNFAKRNKGNPLFSNSIGSVYRKAIRNLYKKSKTFKEENAIDVLYFAVGYLKWYESKDLDISHLAPILFLPVEIYQSDINSPFKVRFIESEFVFNDSLIQKMLQEFNLDLSYTFSNSDSLLYEQYVEYTTYLSSKFSDKRWDIQDDIDLGIFSFSKINMVKDLDENKEKIVNNNLIRNICGIIDTPTNTSTKSIKESDIDNLINPHEYFHILDSDSSQEVAVQSALLGESFVLQGPPGTGKSQTITNIISELIAHDKKILFVAEKKAALDVVYKNLKKVGLADYALPIHNTELDKKSVVTELYSSLEKGQNNIIINQNKLDSLIVKYLNSKQELLKYKNTLLEVREPIKKNLYELYGSYLALSNINDLTFDIENIENYDESTLEKVKTLLSKFQDSYKTVNYSPSASLFYGLNKTNLSLRDKERLFNEIAESREALDKSKEQLTFLGDFTLKDRFGILEYNKLEALITHFKSFTALDQEIIAHPDLNNDILRYEEILTLKKAIDDSNTYFSKHYDGSWYELNSSELLRELRLFSSLFKRIFSKRYKQIVEKVIINKIDPKISYKDLFNDLNLLEILKADNGKYEELKLLLVYPIKNDLIEAIRENLNRLNWYNKFTILNKMEDNEPYTILNSGNTLNSINILKNNSNISSQFNTFNKSLELLNKRVDKLQESFNITQINFKAIPISKLSTLLSNQLGGKEQLDYYVDFFNVYNEVVNVKLFDFINKVIVTSPRTNLYEIFLKRFYKLLIDKYLTELLPTFSSESFNLIKESFISSEKSLFANAKNQIDQKIIAKIPDFNSIQGYNVEVATLKAEANKSRKIMPFRTLFQKIPNLIRDLKPCLMMSPLSVATFLKNSDLHFDAVIFDEASQVRPENSIGAIFRASQVIITGDKEQLPPTNFFLTNLDSSVSEDSFDTTSFDSILEVSGAILKNIKLRWHYRSKFEELIAPSNNEIYQNLVTFPSSTVPTNFEGIKFYKVDGVYLERKNEIEASKVVELIKEIYLQFGVSRSIGVVTFNSEQQELVERKILKLRREDSKFEELFSSDLEEPIFIKNIETVQGDERDIIIISVAYGPDSNGRILHNFGPLNQENGYRRLNVAITRAKIALLLVTSMSYSDIDLTKTDSRGAKFLKNYLEYAEFSEKERANSIGLTSDSEVIQNISEELIKLGYNVKCNVGCSSYKIDIAVVDKNNPNNYVLALEVDGSSYLQSDSIRDHDRLREEVLESRDWKVKRIWSTDYLKNKEKVLKSIIDCLNGTSSDESKTSIEEETTEETIEVIPINVSKKNVIDIDFLDYPNYKDYVYTNGSRLQLVHDIIRDTSPISVEEFKKIVPSFYGRLKFTSIVEHEVLPLINKLLRDNMIMMSKDNKYFIYQNKKTVFRKFGTNSSKRDISNISEDELSHGLLTIINFVGKISRENLYSKLIDYLGFSVISANMRGILDNITTSLIYLGKVMLEDDYIKSINPNNDLIDYGE